MQALAVVRNDNPDAEEDAGVAPESFLSASDGYGPKSATRGLRIGDHTVGGSTVSWFAGPQFVESSSQMVAVGSALKEMGVQFVRAAAFRPEAPTGEFNGMGCSGLRLLKATAERFGLRVVSEICDAKDVDVMLEFCDVIEISRNCVHKKSLLREVGYSDKTVILHRGATMTLDDFMECVKYAEKGGRANLILAENGICSFDPRLTHLLDLSSIITLKRETPYPVLVDCCKAAWNWTYAEQLAIAAVAAGADGIMAEVSPDPDSSRVMSQKALLPQQLSAIIKRVTALKHTLNALVHEESLG